MSARDRSAACRGRRTASRPRSQTYRPQTARRRGHAGHVAEFPDLSGFTRPSKANQIAFDRAVDQVARAAQELLGSLVTNAPPRYREVEAAKARARTADRFRLSDARRAD